MKVPRGAIVVDAPLAQGENAAQSYGVSKRINTSFLTPNAIQQDFVRAALTYAQAATDARGSQLRLAVISGLVVDAIVGLALAFYAMKSETGMLTTIVAGSVAAQLLLAVAGFLFFSGGMSGEQKRRFFIFLLGASFVRVFEFIFAAFAFVFVISGVTGGAGGAVVSFVDQWTTNVADYFYDLEGRSNRDLMIVDITKAVLAFMPTVILAMTGGLAFARPRPALA
ncbi:hypothetical protein [Hyphococcus sp.]|uniref:hypothetical protein n=1 Tax=Hyphococcus sp. TaxID=2038636 RepID=UPI003D0AA35C